MTVLKRLAEARIKMESVAEELESNGVRLFAESFAQLLDGLQVKTAMLRADVPA
jgi:transaldolase